MNCEPYLRTTWTDPVTGRHGYLGVAPPAARVCIQGFGSMGGSTARYLAEAGVRVVAVADAGGVSPIPPASTCAITSPPATSTARSTAPG
ncbi:MAG TPA: hypothetical protein VNG93_12775 [Candidatus Dormibacteraeota bacterium]|nr:hypothetical protein [Candidatus Dormibacteraeota bacterium]